MNKKRKFLENAIATGLELGLVSAADLLKEVNAEVLARDLSVALKSKLIGAALKAQVMDASLVLEVVGVQAMCEQAPVHLLWNAVRDSMARSMSKGSHQEANSRIFETDGNGTVVNPKPLALPLDAALKRNRSSGGSAQAGATSRRNTRTSVKAGVDAFDVETGVSSLGASSSDFEIIDESEILGEETNPGLRKN